MLTVVIGLFWFYLPAVFANMAPVFLAKLWPRFDTPIDFGRSWKGVRIFGDHKTCRGLLGGVLLGALVGVIQAQNAEWLLAYSLVDYATVNAPLLGGLLAFGALMGDAVKSFFKRRVGIPPGGKWFPFDQIDFILGATIFTLPLYVPSLLELSIAIMVTVFGHMLVKRLGFWMRLSDVKW